MTNDQSQSDGGRHDKPFDLAERTAVFGEQVIEFVKQVPSNDVTSHLKRQLLKSGTSIGANYTEADEAGSKKEFRHFISICKRESKEAMYWLRMMATALPDKRADTRRLWCESRELNRIFAAIFRNSQDD